MTDMGAFLEQRLARPEIMSRILEGVSARLDREGENADLLRTAAGVARGLGDLEAAAGFCDRLAACDPADGMAPRMAALLRDAPDPQADSPLDPVARPLPFVRRTGVLSVAEQAALWAAINGAWEPTAVYSESKQSRVDPTSRHSLSLVHSQPVRALMADRIDRLVRESRAIDRLGLSGTPMVLTELSLVSHLDGGKFVLHVDPGGQYPDRCLTFVYYFCRQPRRFDGGDLILFDPVNGATGVPAFTRLRPDDNCLVLFNPHQLHAVQPVHCSSTDPLDGRLAVTGWYHIRRDDAPMDAAPASAPQPVAVSG